MREWPYRLLGASYELDISKQGDTVQGLRFVKVLEGVG